MKHLTILLGTLMLTLSTVVMAQEDDMYFTPKKEKKANASKSEKTTRVIEVVYESDEPEHTSATRVVATAPTSDMRDVDEYNRRGKRYSSVSPDTLLAEEVVEVADTRQTQTYQLSAQSLYDLGYSEG